MRSKTLRSMTVTVLSSDGSILPTQVTVTVPINGVNKDLIRALSTACSLRNDETLLVAMTFVNSITHFLDRLDDSLDVVLDSRVLVAYRLLKNEDSWPIVVFIHNSGEYLEKFGIPMVARIHPDRCNGVETRQKFLELLKPFRVGEASCVNERFEFFMTIDRFTLEVSETVMDNELLVVPSSGEICVFATWPDEMLKRYDTEILSHSPPISEIPDSVVSLYQCLERLLGETIEDDDTDLKLKEWWYLQSVKNQKHIMKMLEKCMGREINLEKRVSELTRVEENQSTHVLEKLYEANNTSLVLMETCGELSFAMKMLEVDYNYEVHRGAKYKDEIQKLKGYLIEAECLVDKYQDKCWELEDERKKVFSVEKEVNDVKVKLQHVEACNEAIKDENNMLRSTIEDMKNNKFSQFEDRIKSLETTLHRMEEANKASAKDTSLCSKLLTFVVMHQMSLEKEQ